MTVLEEREAVKGTLAPVDEPSLISKLFCKRQISLYFRHTLEYRARHALNSAGEEVFHMADNFTDHTQTFNFEALQQPDMQQILTLVYDALKEKGYNPISQIVGYILSEDPTYITTHNNARSLIRKIDRDELLKAMVRTYLGE